jgi:SAM-dependent methyltransferase
MSSAFDGPGAWLTAKIMARMNAEAEREAVERLAPGRSDRVLVIGFGPGVGLARLAAVGPGLQIVGIDPSGTMLKVAARRNRRALASGQMSLIRSDLSGFRNEGPPFDGVVAVHSLQFCRPLDVAAGQLAVLMRPGARLVTITHDWAMARHAGSVDAFVAEAELGFAAAGFSGFASGPAKAEKGGAILVTATR